MDKYEQRRVALQRLVASLGHGGISKVAARIGKEPNYVSRMIYPDDKRGRKRIGEDSADLITNAYPEWLQAEPDTSSNLYNYEQSPFRQFLVAESQPAAPKPTAARHGVRVYEDTLMRLSDVLNEIAPVFQDAGSAAVMKWLRGEVSVQDAAITIDALVEASVRMSRAKDKR